MLPEGTASAIDPSGERVDVHPIAKTETVLQKIDSVAKDQRTATLFERMIPGMVGSFISSFLVNPLDVVRIRLQSQGPAISAGYPHLNGTVDGLLNIYKHEGVRALWAGLTPTLTMAVPSTAVYMIMYENFRDYFVKHGIQSDFAPLLAGSIARSIGTFAVSPIEMVRTRMQQGQLEGSLRQVTRRMSLMVQTEGYTYLWKGLTPSLLRDVPFSALYWYGYEKLKSIQLRELDPATEKTWSQTIRIAFLSGALSGMFAAFFTTPFDVAKTRRQMELNNLIDKSVLTSAEQRTVFQILRHVYRVEGYKGLFSGATARMVKVAPASAITISAYEISKHSDNGPQKDSLERNDVNDSDKDLIKNHTDNDIPADNAVQALRYYMKRFTRDAVKHGYSNISQMRDGSNESGGSTSNDDRSNRGLEYDREGKKGWDEMCFGFWVKNGRLNGQANVPKCYGVAVVRIFDPKLDVKDLKINAVPIVLIFQRKLKEDSMKRNDQNSAELPQQSVKEAPKAEDKETTSLLTRQFTLMHKIYSKMTDLSRLENTIDSTFYYGSKILVNSIKQFDTIREWFTKAK